MYYENRKAEYYEKSPIDMTEEEAKLAVSYWKAKYEVLFEIYNRATAVNDLPLS